MYHPPQRVVEALILSVSRWIRASFHLPKLHSFEDHLRRTRAFFTLTGVDLGTGPLPFLALRASAIQVVAPRVPAAELGLSVVPDGRPRAVSCYLEQVALHGTLELLPGTRTSDFLGHQDAFIVLRDVRVVPAVPGLAESVPVLFVNARSIIAVAEEPEPVASDHDEPERARG